MSTISKTKSFGSKIFGGKTKEEESGSVSSPSSPRSKKSSSSSRKNAFGQSSTKDFLYFYEDPKCMRRMFFNSAPIACVVIALESSLDLPIFFDVLIVLSVAFFLSFLHLFTSRLASLVTLHAGALVMNLNTTIAPRITLYESHRDPACRVLRQAISMLGMEVEIRSVPIFTPGVPSPWRVELEGLLAAKGLPSTTLPYLVGLDERTIGAKMETLQGDGVAMAKELLSLFALDPKECFPLDLDGKLLLKLASAASFFRRYLPYGLKAVPISWRRLNEVRREANLAAGGGNSGDVVQAIPPKSLLDTPVVEEGVEPSSPTVNPLSPTNSSDVVSPISAPSSSPSPFPSPRGGPAALVTSPSLSSISASPSTPRSVVSPTGSSTSLVSSNEPSTAALKLRAQLQRQAQARAGGSHGRSGSSTSILRGVIEEDFTDAFAISDLQPLTVYGTEASPNCRAIFELCCSLQLPYVLYTCASGSLHRAKLILDYGDKWKLPTLIDPNTRRVMIGTPTCVEYILATYTDQQLQA